MGDRVVDCARLESVCAERHRGFESPPIRAPIPTLARLLTFPFQHLQLLSQFHHAAVRQNSTKVHRRINHAVASNHRTWIDHSIAADFGPVTDDRPEFSETGWNLAVWRDHRDFAVIELYVGENHARA